MTTGVKKAYFLFALVYNLFTLMLSLLISNMPLFATIVFFHTKS